VRRASGDKQTGPVVAQPNVQAPQTATMGRVKTQWTGNLSVPEVEAAPAKKSRLPMILGAAILAGGAAAAAAVMATRGGGTAPTPAPGSASGAPPVVSAPATPPTTPTTPVSTPPTPPPPTPPAEVPLAFERTQIRLDSAPSKADVLDPASGKVIGHTPFSFTLPASHKPRQFGLHRGGYVDALVEIVPDRPKIEYTEPLERGAATSRPPVVHHATTPTTPTTPTSSDTPVTRPGEIKPPPGEIKSPPAEIKPPPGEIKPPPGEIKPPPGEIKPPPKRPEDEIELKADPSRAGSGSSTP
jgi:hypothetical protein